MFKDTMLKTIKALEPSNVMPPVVCIKCMRYLALVDVCESLKAVVNPGNKHFFLFHLLSSYSFDGESGDSEGKNINFYLL